MISATQWVLTVLSVFVVWLGKFVRRSSVFTSKCAHAVFACFLFFHVLSFFSVSRRSRDARLAPSNTQQQDDPKEKNFPRFVRRDRELVIDQQDDRLSLRTLVPVLY